MINASKIIPSFSASDLTKIKEFYTSILGLEINEEFNGGMSFKTPEGSSFMVYVKGDQHEPATYTVLNFIVEDVESAVEFLGTKGITMEQYDFMGTNEKGIAGEGNEQMAWFKDPSGNILSIMTEH